jgi:hypothetical protein
LYDNKDYNKARFNIFRRIWQFPMNQFEMALRTGLGMTPPQACLVRNTTSMLGKLLIFTW